MDLYYARAVLTEMFETEEQRKQMKTLARNSVSVPMPVCILTGVHRVPMTCSALAVV